MSFPSTYPRSRRPWRNASVRAAMEETEEAVKNPIRGTFLCCCASAMAATASNAPANRIDARAVFLNGRLIWALFIMQTGAKKTLIYEHHFSVAEEMPQSCKR